MYKRTKFSVLKRLKSYILAMIGQTRLNSTARLYIYHDVVEEINLEKLMDEFISRNTKRATVFAKNYLNIFV